MFLEKIDLLEKEFHGFAPKKYGDSWFRWQYLCRQHGYVELEDFVCTSCRDIGIWKSKPLNVERDLKLIRRIYMEQKNWGNYLEGQTREREISICCSKHFNASTFCKVWMKEEPEDQNYLLGFWCTRCKNLETYNKKNFNLKPFKKCVSCSVETSKKSDPCGQQPDDFVLEFTIRDDYSWHYFLFDEDEFGCEELIGDDDQVELGLENSDDDDSSEDSDDDDSSDDE